MTGLLPHNHGVLWVTHTVDDDQGRLREDNMHWLNYLRMKAIILDISGSGILKNPVKLKGTDGR